MTNNPITETLSAYLNRRLKEKRWSLLDFCAMLGGISKSAGSKILNGKQNPSFRQIVAMSTMFDITIEELILMRLQEEASQEQGQALVTEGQQHVIKIFKCIPVDDMISNHWVGVQDRSDPEEMRHAFEPYLADLENAVGLARKSNPQDIEFSNLQIAWTLRVRNLARRMHASQNFSQSALRSAICSLRNLMNSNGPIQNVPEILSRSGIRLVLVECRNSKIDAVCTWLDPSSPVIGMTLRFDRVDNFWFNLRHELRHVEQGYQLQPVIDCDIGKESVCALESQANRVAQEFCAPESSIDEFLKTSGGRISNESVESFAKDKQLNVAVLAGQIRHRLRRYNVLNKLLTSYREDLLSSAPIVEGWGIVRI